MTLGPEHEPSSEIRNAARMARSLFISLEKEGFSKKEAMEIMTTILKASIHP